MHIHKVYKKVFKPTKSSFGVVKMSVDHTWSFCKHINNTRMYNAYIHKKVFKPTKASFGVVKMSVDHTMSFIACADTTGHVCILDVSGLQAKREPESVICLYKVRKLTN